MPVNPFKQNGAEEEATVVVKELPYPFEKELIENQNKHIHLMHEFVPVHKVLPLESKFYSKHEQLKPDYRVYLQTLQANQRYTSRWTSTGQPRLESQVYGWDQRDCSTEDLRAINFIVGPKQRCDMTAFGEQLIASRITERPVFNGLRFFVR